MRGDFTRNTFDRTKHFSRVLKQQGRVDLDADFNESGAIQQHLLQSLAKDLIGPHGGSANGEEGNVGFGVVDLSMLTPEETQRLEDAQVLPLSPGDFLIGKGHYYVDGILCENEDYCSFLHQPDLPGQPELDPNAAYLVYLDVWERHITALEDDKIREKALNGPDTASRAKVVWQVKVADRLSANDLLSNDATCESIKERWSEWVQSWRSENRGLLKAATNDVSEANLENPCITPPEARYRGAENQLYRVEVHKGGKAGNEPFDTGSNAGYATFKWSRDNGCMTFPVIQLAGGEVTLGYLGRDSRHSLEKDQWVELVDDDLALRGEVRPLGKVTKVDRERMVVSVEWPEDADLPYYANEQEYSSKHVLLRRWDHTDQNSSPDHIDQESSLHQPFFDPNTGTLFISESDNPNSDHWLTLENGIRVSFAKSAGEDHYYQTGDYWLIPARTATGDIEWPWERDASGDVIMRNNRPVPVKRPPHGVEHHYAPLAVITPVDGGGQEVDDCRRQVGSMVVSDYDLRRALPDSARFTAEDADGAERTPFPGFQPKIIFAHGYCNFTLPGLSPSLGNTVWAFADNRNGAPINSCSGFSIQILSISNMWVMSGKLEDGLCYASFTDNRSLQVELGVVISSWSPFTITLRKAIPEDPIGIGFDIVLNLYGLG